jgi:hypothetical protein
MAKPRNSSVAEIARRLETTPVPGSPNRISVEQLQTWAVEYKATAELLSRGVAPDAATWQLQNLWNHLEQLL